MFIPAYQIEAIKSQINMFDVCDKYGIDVNRSGFAICPFHDDSNPSMKVYPSNRGYHCYVCHAGGDVIDFVSKYFSIPFHEALKRIDEDFGLNLGIGNALTEDQEKEHRRISYQKRKRKKLLKRTENELYEKFYDALDWKLRLERLKAEFAPKTPSNDFDPVYEFAVHELPSAADDVEIADTKLTCFLRENRF